MFFEPYYILTMDHLPYRDFDGIRQINIVDWLLGIADF